MGQPSDLLFTIFRPTATSTDECRAINIIGPDSGDNKLKANTILAGVDGLINVYWEVMENQQGQLVTINTEIKQDDCLF